MGRGRHAALAGLPGQPRTPATRGPHGARDPRPRSRVGTASPRSGVLKHLRRDDAFRGRSLRRRGSGPAAWGRVSRLRRNDVFGMALRNGPPCGGTRARRRRRHGVSNPVRHPSDRLRSIDVLGDAGARKTVAGSALQSALGSKALSTWITRVEVRGRSVVAEGRGFGHGVGMCQVGAGTLARRGADAGAILATYYPGAVVAPLWPHP